MSANRIDRAGQAALCAERACRRLWVALEAEVLSVWTDARRHGKDEISPGSSPTHRRTYILSDGSFLRVGFGAPGGSSHIWVERYRLGSSRRPEWLGSGGGYTMAEAAESLVKT